MKLLRIGQPGHERPAVLVDGNRVLEVSHEVGDYDSAFFAGGGLDRLREIVTCGKLAALRTNEGERIGSPIARPGKVVGIGLNYADHARESGAEPPAEPVIFFKAPNTVVGPYDDLSIPPGSEKTDWEVELGVVIGSTARYLPDVNSARACVAGFVISNDVSERAFQLERGGQWAKGKSCETFNPLGPWLVTSDEVLDPSELAMWLDVNGKRMQDSSTNQMIFGIDQVIWYLSQFMVLEPGDLINTGTPAGVGLGLDPPRYLEPGDVVELGIDGLGTQRQACRRTSPGTAAADQSSIVAPLVRS